MAILLPLFLLTCASAPQGTGLPQEPPNDGPDMEKIALTLRVHKFGDPIATGTGSGFFVRDDLVVTCSHVIQDATRIEVISADGERWKASTIAAENAPSDVAVLRVDRAADPSRVLRLSRDEVRVGDPIRVVSNPTGRFAATVTDGQITALREAPSSTFQEGKRLQFNNAVSGGSSGAPILNGSNEVVGLVSYKVLDGDSINFGINVAAIPSPSGGRPITLMESLLPKIYGAEAPQLVHLAKDLTRRGYGISALELLDSPTVRAETNRELVNATRVARLEIIYSCVKRCSEQFAGIENNWRTWLHNRDSPTAYESSAVELVDGLVRRSNREFRALLADLFPNSGSLASLFDITPDDLDLFVQMSVKRSLNDTRLDDFSSREGEIELDKLTSLEAERVAEASIWRLLILDCVTADAPSGWIQGLTYIPLRSPPPSELRISDYDDRANTTALIRRELWNLGKRAAHVIQSSEATSARATFLLGLYSLAPFSTKSLFLTKPEEARKHWLGTESNRVAFEIMDELDPKDATIPALAWLYHLELGRQAARAEGVKAELTSAPRHVGRALVAALEGSADLDLIAACLSHPISRADRDQLLAASESHNVTNARFCAAAGLALLGRNRDPLWGSKGDYVAPPTERDLDRARKLLIDAINLWPRDRKLHENVLSELAHGPGDIRLSARLQLQDPAEFNAFEPWCVAWEDQLRVGAEVWNAVRRRSPNLASAAEWSGWDHLTHRHEWPERAPQDYESALSVAREYVNALEAKNWLLAYRIAGGDTLVSAGGFLDSMESVSVKVVEAPYVSSMFQPGEVTISCRLQVDGKPSGVRGRFALDRFAPEKLAIELSWSGTEWRFKFGLFTDDIQAGFGGEQRTTADLAKGLTEERGERLFSAALRHGQFSGGVKPSSAEELAASMMALGQFPCVRDHWDHPYRMHINADDPDAPYGGFELISVGPNGIFESGAGDDVTISSPSFR